MLIDKLDIIEFQVLKKWQHLLALSLQVINSKVCEGPQNKLYRLVGDVPTLVLYTFPFHSTVHVI